MPDVTLLESPDITSRAQALLHPDVLGDMGHSEYDAAWVARVPGGPGGGPAFPEVLRVVESAQAPDGGWAPHVNYQSARILATLASILAVAGAAEGRERAARGAEYVLQAWQRLDPREELTIGFELLAPALIRDACARGLPLGSLLDAADALQREKLARLPEALVYEPGLSASFSLEFLGDRLDPARAARVRLSNGSIGASVAATAYYACRTGDPAAMEYLRGVVRAHGADNIPYGPPRPCGRRCGCSITSTRRGSTSTEPRGRGRSRTSSAPSTPEASRGVSTSATRTRTRPPWR
jgi:hypothetical protein